MILTTGTQMRISEILNEGYDLKTTIQTIAADITANVPMLFNEFTTSLERYTKKHETVYRFGFVKSGIFRRWGDAIYTDKLERELADLVNLVYKGKKEFSRPRNLENLSNFIVGDLVDIGNKINSPELLHAAKVWKMHEGKYERFFDTMLAEWGAEKLHKNFRATPAQSTLVQEPNTGLGQQRSQVEQIVNNVLASLPKSIAGEIRNVVARSANKLATLKSELDRRNINL
jgi:hypothetical protein